MLGINATYRMRPGGRAAFLREVADCGLLEAVRQEQGCRRYDYFLPLDDPDSLLVVERWDSPEDQQRHLAQPHMALLAAAKARWVTETALETYSLLPQD